MPDISADLLLELDQAFGSIDEVGSRLTEAGERAADAIAQALSDSAQSFDAAPVAVSITAAGAEGGAGVQEALGSALDTFDAAPIEAGLVEAGAAGGDAVAGSLAESIEGFDASPIAAEIAGVDATVPVEADISAVAPAIADAVTSVEAPPIPIEVDASDGLEALRELQGEIGGLRGEADELATSLSEVGTGTGGATAGVEELSEGTSAYSTIASTATISTGVFTKSGEGLGKTLLGVAQKAGPAGIAVAGVATSIGALGLGASEAADINKRYEATFGDLAAEIEHVNVGGLNEDLSELSIQTGNSDDDLRQMAITLGSLGEQSGRGRESVAATVEQVIALSIALSTANPALGDAVSVADRLPAALARGGRTAAAFGLNLNAAEIEARALADTSKDTADELTQYDKAAAGAALASEQLGNTLGTKVTEGAKAAEIRLRSAKVAIGETLEALGAPLVEPVVNILEVATTALTSLFGLLEDTQILDAFGAGMEFVGDVILGVVDAVNLMRPGISALFALLPGGEGPIEAFKSSMEAIEKETGKVPGTMLLAKLGIGEFGDQANLMSDNLAGAAASASEYTLSIDDVTFATEEAAEAHNAFIESVRDKFPEASDAISRFSKDSEISFKEFQKDLTDTAAANETFVKNLDEIIQKGGLQIAASLAELGPEVAGRAAAEIAKQTPKTIAALEEQEGAIRRRLVELAIETARIQSEAKAAAILIDGGIPKEAALTVVEETHGTILARIAEMTPEEAATYINSLSTGITGGTLTVSNSATGVIGTASAAASREGLLGGGRTGGSWVFGVDETLGRSGGTLTGAARGAAGALGAGSGTAYGAGVNVGANFIAGLAAAIASGLPGLRRDANNIGHAIGASANAGIRASSPSKDGMQVAQNFIDGIQIQLRKGAREVAIEAAALGASIGDAATARVADFPAFRLPDLIAKEPSASALAARSGSSFVVAEGALQITIQAAPGTDEAAVRRGIDEAVPKIYDVLNALYTKAQSRPGG